MKRALPFRLSVIIMAGWLLFAQSICANYIRVNEVEDAYIVDNQVSKNFGAATTLITGDNGQLHRFFLRFPVQDSLPKGAIVDSADIYLYFTSQSGGGETVSAYRVLRSWNEGSSDGGPSEDGAITWNSSKHTVQLWTTAGADNTTDDRSAVSSADVVLGVGTEGAYFAWRVTNVVQVWEDSAGTNYGFIFINSDEVGTAEKTFDSREGTNAPYMDVWYRVPPAITGLSASATLNAAQSDSATVTIEYEVTDFDEDSVDISGEYQLQGDGWLPMTNTSGDTGLVDTSANNDRAISWDLNNGLGTDIDSIYTVRLIATDDSGNTDTVTSASFRIDTRNPAALTGLAVVDSTETTISLNWTAGSDNHFSHYEIWYGKVLANVEARNASAYEWDNADDADLFEADTTSTIVTGLEYDTKYYFKIWALDSAGNEREGGIDSATTKTSAAPLVSGPDPAADPIIIQYDSSNVRIQYEVNDLDDDTVTVTLEFRKTGGAWDNWAAVKGFVSGDTGRVVTSGTTDREIIWDVRGWMVTEDDTTCEVRVIAADVYPHYDTALVTGITVDTKDPVNLAGLNYTDSTSSTVALAWTQAADENFGHYEIWYGLDSAEVANRGVAAEWDNDPNDAALASQAANSTTITGLLADTTYFFRIWALDAFGNELADGIISVLTDSVDTKQITNIIDNTLNGGAVQFNYGGSAVYGGATAGFGGGLSAMRTLLKITDFNDVPAGATITSATLYAYCWNVKNATVNTVSAYRVLRNWTEGTANGSDQAGMSNWNEFAGDANPWQTAGCAGALDRNAEALASTAVAGVAWYNWVITDIVKGWFSGDSANQGLLFMGSTEAANTYKHFYSSEGANVPYVDIEYVMNFPNVTGLSAATEAGASQVGRPDTVYVDYEVFDPNDSAVTISLQYKLASGGSWAAATNTAGKIGSGINADTSYRDKRIMWSARAQLGADIDNAYLIRVIASDGALADTAQSASFRIDTKNPVGPTGFSVKDSLSYSVELEWSSVTDETNFSHYEVWYGSDKSKVDTRTTPAQEWDGVDDSGLRNVGTTSTTVTGLSASTKYHFKIWAVDSMTNVNTTTGDSCTTLDDPVPTVTGWGGGASLSAVQTDTARVRVGYEVVDIDDTVAVCSLQYTASVPISWLNATISSGKIDTIKTGEGIRDTVFWNIYTDLGDGTDAVYKVRVHCVDTSLGLADTTESALFDVDITDPVGLASLSLDAIDAVSASLSWTAVTTETHFDHYEIWYGTALADVQARSGVSLPLEWDADNDADLSEIDTTSTVITSLIPSSTYYFQIWAQDAAGNEDSIAWVTGSTAGSNNPVVTGWSDAPNINASQLGADTILIGYEVDDANTDTLDMVVQYQLQPAGSWTGISDMRGDTGRVANSGFKAQDTVWWSAAAQLGGVEASYKVRVIGDDQTAQDTTTSVAFNIDTRKPQGPSNFAATDTTGSTTVLSWTAATDANFNHYEIWYGTDPTKVDNQDSIGGGAKEWDNADDGALAAAGASSTTIIGLTPGTTYYLHIWAYDSWGRDSNLTRIQIVTKTEVTPAWNLNSIGSVGGAAVTESRLYIGTSGTGTQKLYSYDLAGNAKWNFSTSAYGGCNMPTYIYSGGAYKIVASAGTWVVGRQDDNTASSQVFSPVNIGSTCGNPYASPDDSTFYVVAGGSLHRRYMSGAGASVSGWPISGIGANTSADPVVYNNQIFVACGANVLKYDQDKTLLGTYSGTGTISLPIMVFGSFMYITPDNANLRKVGVDSMGLVWSQALGATNTAPAFSTSGLGVVYVAAGNLVEKVIDNGQTSGGVPVSFDALGAVSGPIVSGNFVYFGRDGGRYFAYDHVGDSVYANWPYTSAGGNATMEAVIDAGGGKVIFGTTAGDVDAFALEP